MLGPSGPRRAAPQRRLAAAAAAVLAQLCLLPGLATAAHAWWLPRIAPGASHGGLYPGLGRRLHMDGSGASLPSPGGSGHAGQCDPLTEVACYGADPAAGALCCNELNFFCGVRDTGAARCALCPRCEGWAQGQGWGPCVPSGYLPLQGFRSPACAATLLPALASAHGFQQKVAARQPRVSARHEKQNEIWMRGHWAIC